jgi:hypothetical protein
MIKCGLMKIMTLCFCFFVATLKLVEAKALGSFSQLWHPRKCRTTQAALSLYVKTTNIAYGGHVPILPLLHSDVE